jgi:hypothetical protein
MVLIHLELIRTRDITLSLRTLMDLMVQTAYSISLARTALGAKFTPVEQIKGGPNM